MSHLVQVKEYTDAASIIADAKARRAMFFAPQPQPRPVVKVRLTPPPKPAPTSGLWTEDQVAMMVSMAEAGKTKKAISKAIGRSIGGIAFKASCLGIKIAKTAPQPRAKLRLLARDIEGIYRLAYEWTPERSTQSDLEPRAWARATIKVIAQRYDLTAADLTGRQRGHRLVLARQQAIWVIARDTSLSLNGIGRLFLRDHTTILHAIRRENERRGERVRQAQQ